MTFFLATAVLLACRPEPEVPDGPGVEPPVAGVLDDLVDLLSGDLPGIGVSEGRVVPLDASTCGGACPGGVNLSSPYGMWTFPEDHAPADGALTFQLAHDEAVVYVGPTPPASRYFSFTLYQYERTLPSGEILTGRGSIAPSLNHRVIGLSADAETPFSQPVALLVTTNPGVAERATELLEPVLAAHAREDALGLLAVPWRSESAAQALREDPTYDPGTIVDFRPGHGPDADHYLVAWRTADPVDPDHPYFDPEAHPGRVYRLEFEDPGAAGVFDYPRLPPDDTSGASEGTALRAARNAVAAELLQRYTPEGFGGVVIGTTNGPRKNGFRCVNGLESCFLNSDDARYLRETRPVRMAGTASALFLVGVLHDEAQRIHQGAADVSYSNVSVVDRDARALTLASRMDRELVGSARAWLPEGVEGVSDAELDTLFVLEVARACSPDAPVCVELPEATPLEARIGWTERVYLDEATHTAPPPSAVWPLVAVGIGPDIQETDDLVTLD